MSYSFNGTTQYLSCNNNPLGNGQLGDHSIAYWVRAAPASPRTTVFAISRSTETSGINNPTILIQNENGSVFYFLRANSSPSAEGWNNGSLVGGAAFNNALNHVCCTLSGTTSTIYVNGISVATTNPGGSVPAQTGMDRLGIAALVRGNVLNYSSLNIAEIGVWNVSLTGNEIMSLSRSVSCDLIRPQSLVFYAPLIRDLVDIRGGLTLTNNNGASVADHPRIYT